MSQSLQKVDILGDFSGYKKVAAEGKPVEDMTVKNLREEVAKWRLFSFPKERKAVNLG